MEEMTGTGGMIEKTKGTAVFHQETLTVPKYINIVMASPGSMLTAHQEYYYPGTNHAMITTVLAVQ